MEEVNGWKSAFFLVFAVLLGSIYFHLKQPDLKKAIILPDFSFVSGIQNGRDEGSVLAKGSWLSTTDLSHPIQTVSIFCFKGDMMCDIAYAEITDEYPRLTVDTEYAEVAKWGIDEIVTEPVTFECAQYVYRINRMSRTVTSTRSTISNAGVCSFMQAEPIVMTLGNGSQRLKSD